MFFIRHPNLLSEHLPGYANETPQAQALLAKLIFAAPIHYHRTGYAFPRQWFSQIGSSKTSFYRLNDKYELFEPLGYWASDLAMCWAPNPIIYELQSLSRYYRCRLYERTGKRDQLARDFKKTRTVGGLKLPSLVPVDVTALDHFAEHGWQRMDSEKPELWQGYAATLRTYTNTEQAPGLLPVDYRQIPNGRVCGVGTNPQNVHRDLRAALLNQCFDYDLVNAHFCILAQQPGYWPTIEDYVENTTEIRQFLMQTFGVSKKAVKDSLLALINGAGEDGELVNILGEKASAFFNYWWVVDLRREIKELRKQIAPRKKIANVLMGIEHELLRAATRDCDVLVPYFDGAVMAHDYETSAMEENVMNTTGYRIKIKKEKIRYEFPHRQKEREDWGNPVPQAA